MQKGEEFRYSDFWSEEEAIKERKIKREIQNFPKGEPRKGIKGKYIKRKNYISRRQSLGPIKKFYYSEKPE